MTQVSLETLVAGISAGRLGSFPTDTVPALATLPEKAELIYTAKGRSQYKPLILMGSDSKQLWDYVRGTDEELKIWHQIASTYWPGALTLVLPASSRIPRAMNPGDPTTIGIRVPRCKIARSIVARTGPLATTSANLSGQPPLMRMSEIDEQFSDVLTLATSQFSENISFTGVPSTVVKWTGQNWQILRQGAITLASS
ncbi:MAG: L-threonylcarbamoyladenylate synthase [Calothrix sp. SM1_7_51]|nr:L-threonylcarbamoyladenylate synthase [Calothrix sp. SM1_7_51]